MTKLNSKLKIAILDFDDIKNPLLNAGQARATFEVGSRLVKMGNEVTIATSKFPGYKDRTQAGLKYVHIGLGSPFIRLNNFIFLFAAPLYVLGLKVKNVDLILEGFVPPFSVLFSPLLTRIPVVGLPSMFNAKEFSEKYHLPFHWIETIGIKFYKYLLPYSNVDSDKAVRLNSEIKFRIVPQGVGPEYLKINRSEPKHILFLGRLDIDQKGIDLLIDAYSKVANLIKYPLVIAGHGSDSYKIAAHIKRLGLESKIKMVGPAYGKKKVSLMKEAAFVAFPSRHDEQSLWTLEALAAGLPLVAFDLPESKWMTSDIALKANPFDVKEFSQLLIKATDKKINEKMSKEAKRFVKKYTWKEVAGSFESFFYEVLMFEHNLLRQKLSFATKSFEK